ncbi:hypothetical protein AC249_AIPGENE19115 [Exaiptasia diaphana]|nr:hypothetical protein AC249_AIPGENE19115 [Exaiptasia diaphana]
MITQKGAIEVLRATSGGAGVKAMVSIPLPSGHDVPSIKDSIGSAVLTTLALLPSKALLPPSQVLLMSRTLPQNQALLTFKKKLFVVFKDEDGLDAGAVSREFFHLALQQIKKRLFIGEENRAIPIKDFTKLFLFQVAGMIIVHSIIQKGATFSCLSPSTYYYIIGRSEDVSVNLVKTDIPLTAATCKLHTLIDALDECNTEESLEKILDDDANMHIISSAHWPVEVMITLKNKGANIPFSIVGATQVPFAARLIARMDQGHGLLDRFLFLFPSCLRPDVQESESAAAWLQTAPIKCFTDIFHEMYQYHGQRQVCYQFTEDAQDLLDSLQSQEIQDINDAIRDASKLLQRERPGPPAMRVTKPSVEAAEKLVTFADSQKQITTERRALSMTDIMEKNMERKTKESEEQAKVKERELELRSEELRQQQQFQGMIMTQLQQQQQQLQQQQQEQHAMNLALMNAFAEVMKK